LSDSSAPIMPVHSDLFSCLQKAQRYALCETMLQVSALDPHSPCDLRYVLAQVRDMLDYSRQFTDHVAVYAVQRMEVLAPGSGAGVALKCEERLRSIAGMLDVHAAAGACADGMPIGVLVDLQHRLNGHVARALAGLDFLDAACAPVMRYAASGEALAALEESMLAGFTPAVLKCGMQWMIPALSTGERLGLMDLLRRRVGAAFAASVLAMSKDLLSPGQFDRLLAESTVSEDACV
jgi:hypothetical protein